MAKPHYTDFLRYRIDVSTPEGDNVAYYCETANACLIIQNQFDPAEFNVRVWDQWQGIRIY